MKPIKFNTDEVKAILAGRKTKTRIIVKPQPKEGHLHKLGIVTASTGSGQVGKFAWGTHEHGGIISTAKVPYQVGDELWVKEPWTKLYRTDENSYTHYDEPFYLYAADNPQINLYDDDGFLLDDQRIKWRPSTHMPKDAARIFLKMTGVRVERLQEMPLYDVWDEGTPQMPGNDDPEGGVNHEDFKYLWDSINTKRGYGWQQNPWVYVITFERTG